MNWRRCAPALGALLLVSASYRVTGATAATQQGSIELTGVLLQAVDASGNPTSLVWHTSNGPGRPLGFSNPGPASTRTAVLLNGDNGEISGIFYGSVHINTLFWQYQPGEYPPALILNFYFNGDNLTPGISALVLGTKGLTQFRVNDAPSTLSLYLGDADNPRSLSYDNAGLRAQLTAAFYMPTLGPTDQWRPTDLSDIDRVGVTDLRPDGQPDGLLIYEMVIGPSAQTPTPNLQPTVPVPSGAAQPLQAFVGGDQWVAPPTSPPLADASRTPSSAQPGADATVGPDASPSPSAAGVATATPPPHSSPGGTLTPGTQTPGTPLATQSPGAAGTHSPVPHTTPTA